MTTPDWVNLQQPRDGATILADPFNGQALIFTQGYTAPFTPVLMVDMGVAVGGTGTSSDGSGFFTTPAVNLPTGFHIIQARAGTSPDTVLSPPAFIDIVTGQEETFIQLDSPTTGSVYQADTDGFAAVDFNGRSDPNMRILIWIDGVYSGNLGYADASGNFQLRLVPLPVGVLNVVVVAGFNPPAQQAQVALTVMGPPTAPPRPPLLPDQTFTWYMNWLADTIINGSPQYSATAAAQIASGAPYGSSLRQSMNRYAGYAGPQYRSVNQILNQLAGTTDLENQAAAYMIAQDVAAGGVIGGISTRRSPDVYVADE